MKKVGLVSNDMWMNKIHEDKNLKYELIKRGIDADIVSWQSSDIDDYNLLVLRSAWGYQNNFKEFKSWLDYLDKNNIKLENNTRMILSNVLKDRQFDILDKNNIKHIDTYFIDNKNFNKDIYNFKNSNIPIVFKPTISGSGENTFLYDSSKKLVLPNSLSIEAIKENLNKFKKAVNCEVYEISAIKGEGIDKVLIKLADMLDKIKKEPLYEEEKFESHVLYKFNDEEPFEIHKENNIFVVTGEKIEKLLKMTWFSADESARRFSNKLKRLGIDDKLKEMGIQEGDIVRILDYEFEYRN